MRRAAFHNLGCKVNAYETEAMEQQLEAAGYEIVPFQEKADVYIINTCSVTNTADKKSRQMLHRAKKLNPFAVVVAVGCYAQAAGEELQSDEAVDLIIGNNNKLELPGILDAYLEGRDCGGRYHVIDISQDRTYEEFAAGKINGGRTRAFIKVQDGCNQFCSYCIIPYTRGRVRSRRPEDVINEVKKLAGAGCREIVVTGIHLSSYGTDFEVGAGADLAGLIGMLNEIDGIERIRLGSLGPGIVTEEFVGALRSLKKVCPHFHLSLQSGCDETLRRMNRKYTAAEYLEKCCLLRENFPHPAITTDVIAGFPGETQEEFERTKEFLESVRLAEMHVFKFSRRRGTRAADMDGQVPENIKAARSDELLLLGERMSRQYREWFQGKKTKALPEEETVLGGKSYLIGYNPEYVRTAVAAGAGRKGEIAEGIVNGELEKGILRLEVCP